MIIIIRGKAEKHLHFTWNIRSFPASIIWRRRRRRWTLTIMIVDLYVERVRIWNDYYYFTSLSRSDRHAASIQSSCSNTTGGKYFPRAGSRPSTLNLWNHGGPSAVSPVSFVPKRAHYDGFVFLPLALPPFLLPSLFVNNFTFIFTRVYSSPLWCDAYSMKLEGDRVIRCRLRLEGDNDTETFPLCVSSLLLVEMDGKLWIFFEFSHQFY